jgi:hypothetical protein
MSKVQVTLEFMSVAEAAEFLAGRPALVAKTDFAPASVAAGGQGNGPLPITSSSTAASAALPGLAGAATASTTGATSSAQSAPSTITADVPVTKEIVNAAMTEWMGKGGGRNARVAREMLDKAIGAGKGIKDATAEQLAVLLQQFKNG